MIIAQVKADQSVQNRYGYSPYGRVASDANDNGNPYPYTGRENDGTGLYFYRARYVDPVQKRFISEDPIGLGGGINIYTYVEGNPNSMIDPEGLSGIGDFSRGAGSYFRSLYRTGKQLARSYGALGQCEKLRSEEEDVILQDVIAELRDSATARDLAKRGIADYLGKHGTYLKGRVTAGVATSVVTPAGLGIGVTALAANGDIRYAIEQGADSVETALAGITGDVRIRNARAQSRSCECK